MPVPAFPFAADRQPSGLSCAAVVAGLSLAALPASADAALLGVTARFVDLARANGCALTEAEGARLLPGAGLTMDDARDAAMLLNRVPLFEVLEDGETLRLLPELCAADAAETAALLEGALAAGPRLRFLSLEERVDPAEGARFLGALRASDCAMTDAQAAETLPALGLEPEAVQDIAAVLLKTGMAEIRDDALHLHPVFCADDPAHDEALILDALDWLADAETAPVPPLVPGLPAVREAVALRLTRGGCMIDTRDPGAATAALTDTLLADFDLPADDPAAREIVAAHVAAALADPGPAYAFEPGRLRLINCTP